MTGLEVGLTAITAVGTVAGGYIGLKLKPLEDKDTALTTSIEKLTQEINERFKGLHDDTKDEHEKMERRIADIEKTYLSRADLTAALKDVNDNMNRGIDRVEAIVRALGAKVDHLAERVGKVEAAP